MKKINPKYSKWLIIVPTAIFLVIFGTIFALSAENSWEKLNFFQDNSQESREDTSESKLVEAKIQGHDEVSLLLEVADTPEAQTSGLMHRQNLEENNGMLFVFDIQDYRTFWMKDTYIPLDIAFLDENKQIVDIHANAEPENTQKLYTSSKPSKFAVETNGGWFEKHEIEVGDLFNFSF